MSRFERTATVQDIFGNSVTRTVLDRNAARTEARQLQSERDNLRREFTELMSQFVVLTPTEQAESGFYGRVYGYQGDLGHTEGEWCFLTFPEWKEVIKSFRAETAQRDARLAAQQAEAKAVAFGRR